MNVVLCSFAAYYCIMPADEIYETGKAIFFNLLKAKYGNYRDIKCKGVPEYDFGGGKS